MEDQPAEVVIREVDVCEAARVRSTWARLIHKVYDVDPLECPKCKGPMRLISQRRQGYEGAGRVLVNS